MKLSVMHFIFIVNSGANIELKDAESMTPLLVASRNGHLETLSWLLKYKADVTETDKDDKTCLMWAAEEDRTDAIKVGYGNEGNFLIISLICYIILVNVLLLL